MNIVLTGFMGSGKSSVGKKLAAKLAMTFIDTDEMIEKDTGCTIAEIFKNKGEPYFREVEARAVALVGLLDNYVIATGGGVPLKKENLDELERNSMIVYLQVSPETAVKRAGHETTRPLLKSKNPLETARNMLQQRQSAYARCDAVIDADALDVETVADRIAELFKKKVNR